MSLAVILYKPDRAGLFLIHRTPVTCQIGFKAVSANGKSVYCILIEHIACGCLYLLKEVVTPLKVVDKYLSAVLGSILANLMLIISEDFGYPLYYTARIG